VTELLILFGIVFAIHLAPAFTPPTFPVIIYYTVHSGVPAAVVIAVAAAAAALGRLTLALVFRYFAHRLPARLRGNLEAAHAAIEARRGSRWLMGGLFLLGSSSAALFEAAGLARLRLAPLTAIYMVGRFPRYWLYATGAQTLRGADFCQALADDMTSPQALAVGLLMIALIVVLVRTDWTRVLKR
jgi:membrane protein YqaA with SNARE-associated domain